MATLTSDYQYIGRSSPVGCAAGWNYYILLYAKTAGDTAAGRHAVTVRMRLACTSDATFYGYGTAGSVTVAGIPAISWSGSALPGTDWSASAPLTEGGVYYYRHTDIAEGTVVVDTGWGAAKELAIAVSWGRVESVDPVPGWLPYYKTYATGSITVTVPALAGAAVITGAGDLTLGEACSVSWTPIAGLYYRLRFFLNSWSQTTGIIAPGAVPYTYTGFNVPLEAAWQLPNSPVGTMAVTLTTYADSGGTLPIGSESTAYFTVTVPAGAGPTVAFASLNPVSSLPAPFDALYIKGKSRVQASLSAAGQYGAAIVSAVLTVEGKAFTDISDYLSTAGEVTVWASVTDSRGYTGSCTAVITVHDYASPTVQVGLCARCDSSGTLTDSGTALRLQVTGSCFPVGGANSARLWYRWKPSAAPDSAFSDPVTLSEGLTFDGVLIQPVLDPQTSFALTVGITDGVGLSAAAGFTVLTEKICWHRGDGFLALGMYSQTGGLECGWPARFYGEVYIGDVPLKTYIQNCITGG